MSNLTDVTSASNADVTINGLLDALAPGALFSRNEHDSSGLTHAYYGGIYAGAGGDVTVANGTLTLTNAATNYVVAHKTTGVVSASTATTNYNDTATYGRIGIAVTSGGVVTSWTDTREATGGILARGGSGSGSFDLAAEINGATAKTTPVNADEFAITDSAASYVLKKLTWANVKATLWTAWGAIVAAGTQKSTPVDADKFALADSAASDASKYATLANIRTGLQGDGLTATHSGFRGIPQNAQTGNYTLVAADAGKHIYHASGDGSGDTYTIPANSSVAFPVGTAVTFANLDSNAVSIAITTDTMYLAGTGTTGTRTLAQYGVATALKVTSTAWVISGSGLT